MKKFIIIICVVSMLAASMIVPTFAAASWNSTHGYPYLVYDGSVINFGAELASGLSLSTVCVLDAAVNASAYSYKSIISYDDLSSLVLSANQHGVICSLYKNERAGYWVAYVTDYDTQWIPFIETDRVYGCLGSIDGYVYVAEIDTTGDETVRVLKNIQTITQAIQYTQQALYNFVREAASDLSYIKMYTDQLANDFDPTKSGTLGEQILHMNSHLTSLDTAVKSLSTQISAQSTKLDSIVTNVAKLDDIHSEITEPNVSGTLAYNIKTIATKTVNIATQLTDSSTSGTMAQRLKSIDSSLSTIKAIVGGQQPGTVLVAMATSLGKITTSAANIETLLTNWESSVTVDTSALEEALLGISNDICSLHFAAGVIEENLPLISSYLVSINNSAADISDLVTLLDPTYQGQFTTLASYIVRICEAVESADSNTTVDTSALETKIDDLHNSLNHYTGVSLAELMEAWWEEMSNGFSAVDSDFSTVNSHLNTSKGYLKNIQSYTSNMKTNIADIETLLTNWETSTVDTTALEEKVADTNAYLSQISDKLDDLTESTVENITNITIDNDNDAYSVFYLTDENGEEESIAEFGGDVLTAGGKLLNFFFRVAFDDALSSVDGAVDYMTEFYNDSVIVGEGANIWE